MDLQSSHLCKEVYVLLEYDLVRPTFGKVRDIVGVERTVVLCVQKYSRTSVNGPSKKQTTSLQRTQSVLQIEITIVVILKQPPRTLLDSGQRTRSTLPTALYNTKLPLNNGHQRNHTLKIDKPYRIPHARAKSKQYSSMHAINR